MKQQDPPGSGSHLEVMEFPPPRKGRIKGKHIAWVLGVIALVLMGVGTQRSYKVYSEEALKYNVDLFDDLNEFQMIEDATFSGVESKDGKLYSTYDRSATQVKRACPT